MIGRPCRRALGATLGLAVALSACAEPGASVLVVHATVEPERTAEVERRFEDASPGVDVRIVRLPAEEALRRARSGGEGERADILWGLPIELLASVAAEGLLGGTSLDVGEPTAPTDAAGRWFALPDAEPFVLAFDTREVARSRAPRDWGDLLHPRWAGEVVLVDPALDPRMRTLLGALIVEEVRRTGDELAGLDFLRGLDRATAVYAPDVRDVMRRLEIGEVSMTILPLAEAAAARAEGRDWLEHRVMESGAPALRPGIAIVAATPHPEAAASFVRLVLDAPARAAALANLELWPAAPDTLAERLDAWMERWRLEVRGRSRVPF
jgi:iron(III) transport system substrate-binding protein